jgi:hypothetical protein
MPAHGRRPRSIRCRRSGAQRKNALYLVSGKWYEPRGRTPSTPILKLPIMGLAGKVERMAGDRDRPPGL